MTHDRAARVPRWRAGPQRAWHRSDMARVSDDEAAPRVIVNAPASRVPFPDLAEVARSRELLYFLTWRDVKVRYKQTAIGAGWAIRAMRLRMLVAPLCPSGT